MTTSAGTYGAATDWLGSVTGLINSTGIQASTTSYSPYGTATTTGSPASAIGYAGSYTQPGGTGLDDMRARDYSPATGSFTSVDPALAMTGQPYTYVSDGPVAGRDPSGLIGWGECLAGLAEWAGMVTGSACLNATLNLSTGEVQFGGSVSTGGGLGMFGVGIAFGPQLSNANQISDLGGPFGTIGASAAFGVSLGADGFTGQGSCNQQIFGLNTQAGVGINLPGPIPFWEIHGGVTYTWQSTFFSFNLYNAADDIGAGLGREASNLYNGANHLAGDFTDLFNPSSWF
jgi:RHS repeat-associated protein